MNKLIDKDRGWPNIQDALQKFFSKTAGITFVWANAPRKMMRKPYGILSLGQSITLGRDQSSYTFRNSSVTMKLYGQRLITVNVQVFSRSENARSVLEKARLLLVDPELKKILQAAGVCFVETHPIVDLDFTFANRKESRASLDVVFSAALSHERAASSVTYFDQVELREAAP